MLSPNFELPQPQGTTQAQSDHEIGSTCALGANVARVVMNWNTLEPRPGYIEPHYAGRIGRMIGGLGRCGIPTELTILGTPCWLTSDPRVARSYCPPSGWRYPPRSVTPFGDVVAWALSQWGGSLAAFEIWNEPNSPQFWLGSPAQYAEMVNEAVDRAHAIGSPVPILAGALAGADSSWLGQLYAAGMRGQSGISLHPYTLCLTAAAFVSPSQASCRRAKGPRRKRRSIFRGGIRRIHQTMLSAGDPGGVWLTEFGFPTCPATPYCVPEAKRARWIARGFHLAASIPYVRAAILFSIRDIGNTLDWNDRFGLLSRDFRPRPSYATVRHLFRGGIRSHRHRRKHRHRR